MTTDSRGGPRPATRPDDRRRNNGGNSGTGPKPKSFTLKLGDKLYIARTDAAGNGVEPSELWTIIEITRAMVRAVSDSGDSIRLVR